MTRVMLTTPPSAYPRHMRHRRSYAANNCPDCLDRDLAHDPFADDRWCDLDINVFRSESGELVAICLHWKRAGRGGFRYLALSDGTRRRLTGRERNVDMVAHNWSAEKVLNLRTRKRGGHRPMTLFEAVEICAEYGAIANPESKPGNPLNLRVKPWRSVAASAGALGVRVVVKTLPMQGWQRRCAVVARAGLAPVLIGGGKRWGPRPAVLARRVGQWPVVWGPRNWRS